MRNVLDRVLEKIKLHFLSSETFFPENRAVYEIMPKNMLQPERPQMSIWRMSVTRWKRKVTGMRTHAHAHAIAQARTCTRALAHRNVILIAFARQLFRELS
jgi:hypothetical protein